MSIALKIKTLLMAAGKKQKEYADKLGSAPQSLQNKFTRQSFSVVDLIDLGDLTGTRLSFIDEHNEPVVTFDTDDVDDARRYKSKKRQQSDM